MTPYFSDAWLDIYQGDVRDVLPSLPADSVDCIVTSPPYWGLRDYGGDGQLGLERTPEEYVANMVGVFRELRRVLKPTGTCWLNLGDSYAGARPAGGGTMAGFNDRYFGRETDGGKQAEMDNGKPARGAVAGLKPKDLVGIPWRVAFALQADGWYLRSDIIWAKPNPMPESVTDRPTKSHEYLFLLTKSARYFFDADAVREESNGGGYTWDDRKAMGFRGDTKHPTTDAIEAGLSIPSFSANPAGRNLRSVWTIATKPYPGAHFAVFPPELPERCIKAGSSERGVCRVCGKPWERVVESTKTDEMAVLRSKHLQSAKSTLSHSYTGHGAWAEYGSKRETTGWWPSCDNPCKDDPDLQPQPAVVLDPFAGSGTTGVVANRLSRRAILVDLNGDYLKQQLKRNAQTPLGLGA